jgi:hypothetical protein
MDCNRFKVAKPELERAQRRLSACKAIRLLAKRSVGPCGLKGDCSAPKTVSFDRIGFGFRRIRRRSRAEG